MGLIDTLKKIFTKPIPEIHLTPFQKRLIRSRRAVKSMKARANAKRTFAERTADWMTATFGSITFLFINVLIFTFWILININFFPDVRAFDPFPFGLLTTIVSLEAIILAVFVLISQNREQRVNDLREEIVLEIDIITENELTKLMEVVAMIAKKQGIDLAKDEEYQEMLKPLNKDKIEKTLEKEIK